MHVEAEEMGQAAGPAPPCALGSSLGSGKDHLVCFSYIVAGITSVLVHLVHAYPLNRPLFPVTIHWYGKEEEVEITRNEATRTRVRGLCRPCSSPLSSFHTRGDELWHSSGPHLAPSVWTPQSSHGHPDCTPGPQK